MSFKYFEGMWFFSFFAIKLIEACFNSHGTWVQIFGPSMCMVRLPISKLVGFMNYFDLELYLVLWSWSDETCEYEDCWENLSWFDDWQ